MKKRFSIVAILAAAAAVIVFAVPEESEARQGRSYVCHTDTPEEQEAHAGDPDYEPTKTIHVSNRAKHRHFREHAEDYEGFCGSD